MKLLSIIIIILISNIHSVLPKTIEVDPLNNGQSLQWAASSAQPGDTILLLSGEHKTGQYISELHGTDKLPIIIMSEGPEPAVFKGGNQAIHFSDVSYLTIINIEFREQTINGVNVDDGGNYDIPTHHIVFRDCQWKDMNATGNNDQLKLSGVDYFQITNCSFENGSSGGSMVDMVGCHNGIFRSNTFSNGGSNSIQAKGGTRNIEIFQNEFINGGQRAVNCGGSTGLAYFRPSDADYEAKNIRIYSNIFSGATTPVGFIGSTECDFINNTILMPSRWIARVLQENTNERFVQSSYNTFANNICYFDNNADHEQGINIGSNTLPETFTFTNNLWYNVDNTNWNGPNRAFNHQETITNQSPVFVDFEEGNFSLDSASPAIGKGKYYDFITKDFNGTDYRNPPSMGAVEYEGIISSLKEKSEKISELSVYPNPASDFIVISDICHNKNNKTPTLRVFSLTGREVIRQTLFNSQDNESRNYSIDISNLKKGIYFLQIDERVKVFVKN